MKALRRLFIIGLIGLIMYIAVFVRFHPTDFIYADGPVKNYDGTLSYYQGGEPVLDCMHTLSGQPIEKRGDGTVYVRDCLVTNVPVGIENMHVKETHPFIYFTIVHPYVCPIIVIAIFLILFGKSFFAKLQVLFKKEEDLSAVPKCTIPALHNFPDMADETKCVWCGRTVLDVKTEDMRKSK